VLGEAVDKVEVEVAQEVWEVRLDDINHSQRRVVERLYRWSHRLAWDHVVLEEGENVHYKLFDFEPFLIIGVVTCCSLHIWHIEELLLVAHLQLLGSLSHIRPKEMRQELLVRDQLEPGEAEGRVLLRA